jgi:cytochrome c2
LAKPLEQTSLRVPFVVLSALITLSTIWALWDEFEPRRPWKDYQRDFFALQEAHLKAELERARKRLEAPEAKAELDAARAEVAEAEKALTGAPEQRKAYEAALAAEKQAREDEAEAKLYLGFDKSEADAIYYLVRHARHDASPEEREHQAELDAKRKEIAAREARFEEAKRARAAATAARVAFEERAAAARGKLAKLTKPVREVEERLAAFGGLGKMPSMEQYWIRNLQNSWGAESVDRCQNCHAGVDTAGFSAPAEVLAARRAGMPELEFRQQYAVDEEVVAAYEAVQGAICEEIPVALPSVPLGGNPAVEPPEAVDPAAATECRPVATYRRWLARSDAYCGAGFRALARTRFVWKDAKGTPVAPPARAPRVQDFEAPGSAEAAHAGSDHDGPADPLAKVTQACGEKGVVEALEKAEKEDLFDVAPVFRTHPDRMELLTRAHPPEKFGCTVCHGGQGSQTKGVQRREFRHGADDHHWNDPLTEEVLVMGRKFDGAFLQAKCEKCHREELTVNKAPLLTQGKKLFVEMGCWGCHPTEGYNDLPKRGPTLANLVSKTTPGWAETWISNPRDWRPYTRMPNFWPGAVDGTHVARQGGETPDAARERHAALRAEEVAQITAFLWSVSTPAPLPKAPARAGSAAKGKQLFDAIGCRACHVVEEGSTARRSEASPTRDYAPNLWNVADKASPEWLYGWVKNPRALWPDTKMPDLRLTSEEAADVVAYLLTLRSDRAYPVPAAFQPGREGERTALAAKGKALVAKYGCFGCHVIPGFETAQKIGTELSEHGRKDPKLLDFGDVHYFTESPKHRETYATWVWTKLHTPRIYAYELVETRMPQFDFTDEEALAVLTFLKGQTGEREKVPRELLPGIDGPKLAVLTGERLVFWNGCRNCHEVERRGAVVRDLFDEDSGSFAPPILTGEGAKVQPPWLFDFLKQPQTLRPWLSIRMPTFHFSDDDAATLVKYFASASRKSFPYLTVDVPAPAPARARETLELFGKLQCTKCHVVGGMRPGQDPGSAAPDFLLARRRLRPDWIPLWLRNPNALMEGTRMPAFWDMDPDAPAPHKAFGGDKQAQMEALRDLLMSVGAPGVEPEKIRRPPGT